MNTGMQDAFNLSWKLNLVINGIAKPSLLDSYLGRAQRRRRHGPAQRQRDDRGRDHTAIRSSRSCATRSSSSRSASRRSATSSPTRCRSSNIGYPVSPLTVAGSPHAHGVKPGTRWPESLPADTSKSLFARRSALPTSLPTSPTKFPKLVEAAAASKHADPRDLILVRPDGYVGFAGAASDRAGAEAYLRGIAA